MHKLYEKDKIISIAHHIQNFFFHLGLSVIGLFNGMRLICIGTGSSQFCELSTKVNTGVTDPTKWFCGSVKGW